MFQSPFGTMQTLIDGVSLAAKDCSDLVMGEFLPDRELQDLPIIRAEALHGINHSLDVGRPDDDCFRVRQCRRFGRGRRGLLSQCPESAPGAQLVRQCLAGNAEEPGADLIVSWSVAEAPPQNDKGFGCCVTCGFGVGAAAEIAVYLEVMGGIDPPEAFIRRGVFEGRSSNHVTP
jgi:hypothetical protein